ALAAARRDIDREAAGGNDVDGVRGLAAPMQHGRAVEMPLIEIGDEVGRAYVCAELPLQPGREAGQVHVDLDPRLGEQLVLAPGEPGVDVGKSLVPALAANEATALESVEVGRRERAIHDRRA